MQVNEDFLFLPCMCNNIPFIYSYYYSVNMLWENSHDLLTYMKLSIGYNLVT